MPTINGGTSRRRLRSPTSCGPLRRFEREPHARSRDDEQQRHAEAMSNVHRPGERADRLGVLDVPAPSYEDHARVIEQQHEDGDDPEPVQKVVTRFGLHACVCPLP